MTIASHNFPGLTSPDINKVPANMEVISRAMNAASSLGDEDFMDQYIKLKVCKVCKVCKV